MAHKFLFLSMCIVLLSACGKKNGLVTLAEPQKLILDESEIVFNSMPNSLTILNDSIVALIANRQTVSMINLRTGKSHHHFSMNAIRIDSVLDKTYNQFYAGKRIYFFDSTNSEENTFQLTDMCFADGHFYIYLNCEVEVKYINDSTALNSNLSAPPNKSSTRKILHF